MNARILLWVGILTQAGCSSLNQSSQYHPKESSEPQGYSETRLEDDKYQVVYEAYKDNDWRRIADFTLYRVAELGKEKGYQYFIIESSQRKENTETIMMPAVHGTTYVGNAGNFGGATTTRSVVTPEYAIDYKMRQVAVTVSYLRENTSGSALGVDAVMSQIQTDDDFED